MDNQKEFNEEGISKMEMIITPLMAEKMLQTDLKKRLEIMQISASLVDNDISEILEMLNEIFDHPRKMKKHYSAEAVETLKGIKEVAKDLEHYISELESEIIDLYAKRIIPEIKK